LYKSLFERLEFKLFVYFLVNYLVLGSGSVLGMLIKIRIQESKINADRNPTHCCKQCCGSGSRIRIFSIPDPNFFHPVSELKNSNILTQKMVSRLWDI
jgi:hypothetical protein